MTETNKFVTLDGGTATELVRLGHASVEVIMKSLMCLIPFYMFLSWNISSY